VLQGVSNHETTLTSWALVIWKTLESYRLDPTALFVEAGLDPQHLRDPNARYSVERMQSLWRLALDASRDQCFGIRSVDYWHPTTFHALGYAWMASSTLRDGLERLVRYAKLVSTVLALNLVQSNGNYELRYQTRPPTRLRDAVAASVDAGLASVVLLCRVAAGDQFSPREVRVKSPDCSCRDRFYAFFRCPVTFECADPAIIFDESEIEEPLPSANAELARANEQIITEYLARFDRRSAAMMVRAKLIEQLPRGDATEASIANALHMSLRSLQRRLQAEGTSYKNLLDGMRRELAAQYMENSTLTINEITYLLGFSEPSNFSRAFKRWNGVPPSQYRLDR
jgi:AraC-like DNA-binding protein